MEAVAEHINEMQKIYEEYGSIFDDLIKQSREIIPNKKVKKKNTPAFFSLKPLICTAQNVKKKFNQKGLSNIFSV